MGTENTALTAAMALRLSSSRLAAPLLGILVCGAASAETPPAQAFTYGADAGIGESDNIGLVPKNGISQTIALADVDFAVREQTRLLEANAKGDFSFLDFLEGAYGSELVGRFDGTGRVAIVPEHLSWVLQDDFGQAQIDPFAPVTPGNRENVNYLSTGPDVDFRLGRTGFVDFTARYARTKFEVSPFDSDRFQSTVAVGLPLSALSTVSVDVSAERVLFDKTVVDDVRVNTDFDRSSVYAHYDLQGARTTLTASAGVTKVDQSNQSLTGPLVKLDLTRTLTSAAKVKLMLGRDVTDATTGFANLANGAVSSNTTTLSPAGTTPAAVTSTNYTVTFGSVGWEYVRNRTRFSLDGRWERDSYGGQPQLDLTRDNADASVQRDLTSHLTAQLNATLYRTSYADINSTERDVLVGGGLTYRTGRGIEVKFKYDHASRVVDASTVADGRGSGYTENRLFLTVGYRPRKAPPQ